MKRTEEGQETKSSVGYFTKLVQSEEFQQKVDRAEAERKKTTPKKSEEGTICLFDRRLKRASLKLEQNLGCELPVCVASHRETKRKHIEVVNDEGVVWRLTRPADGRLPAPEHYGYWMWFLDRNQAAAESGLTDPPMIAINPSEIFDLLGAPRWNERSGHNGWRYDALDTAFERFSSLVVCKRNAFFVGKRSYSGKANLGTLCSYASWRAEQREEQRVAEFVKGWVKPGTLLWESIRAGYLKSVPLEPLRHLNYVEQRLLTYLAKHCKPDGEFAIAPSKILPKIPLHCPSNKLRTTLGPRHEALARVGFLRDARIEGRGINKLLVYERTEKGFTSKGRLRAG